MWIEWFAPSSLQPILWIVLGTLGMYLTILGFARWSGVRSFAEMSTFDIAVTIALGSLVATTIVAKTPPLLQGMTAVATLFAIQLVVSRLRSRFAVFKTSTDNAPILLMGPGGTLKPSNMRIARVTEDDLRTHLRKANVVDPSLVQAVVMEGTGTINVLHSHAGDMPEDGWILQGVRDYDGAGETPRT
ncbi:DUF421 domain-containing protein [Fodinicurvata halophila]|uniref:DUF421 domain-containing protein n=1 Tax=Fodinicurvata halophila TaxID=1419723 RepID=A0ABV8ULQ4_9PROT